jgi:site-specific DNA-cytosine methylase
MSFCFAPEVASGSVSGAEIRVKRPTVGILENNRTLGKQNIAAIIEILNEAGVFVKQFGAEASDYRSPSRRNRNYFITIAVGAVKIDQTAHDFIEPAFVQRFVKVLAQKKLGPGLAASIMLPVQEDAAGMYTPEDLVDSLALKRQVVDDKPDDEPAWRSHHLDIFRRALMVWPPSYEGEELAAFRAATKHLSERMRQNCFYFSFHPIAENTVRPDTYHDVHMTLKWNPACMSKHMTVRPIAFH